MVSRRTRVVSWIFRRDHPSRPNAMICCFFSSFKTFAMLREATYPPAAVNVLDVSSESMAAFQVFLYGRFWVFTEDDAHCIEIALCHTRWGICVTGLQADRMFIEFLFQSIEGIHRAAPVLSCVFDLFYSHLAAG